MSDRYQTLVDDLIALDWPFCEAVVESVQIKAKTTKITLVVEGDSSLHALADAAGGTVLLVVDNRLGKPADGDVRQNDLFVPGQEAAGEKPQAAPSAAFNPETDMPPDDDPAQYGNPIEDDDDGIFDEVPGKPPFA